MVALACPAITDDRARRWVKRLERRISARDGVKVEYARPIIARELGKPVTPGMVRGVSEGRIKGIREWLSERIRNLLIRELEAEIRALTHDLEMARQSGAVPGSDEVLEIETLLATARALLKQGAKP